MIKISSLKVGESATNCYLIWDEKTKEAIIVDPGDSADYIERIIADLSLRPTQIIITHGHGDHTGAALELSLAFKIPVLMNRSDEFLLKRLTFSPRVGKNLQAGDLIGLGEDKLKVIATPGHTPGSISLYSASSKFAAVGDICFADNTFGRTDFAYSDAKTLKKSLQKIKKLSGSTTIYPGHGEDFKVAKLVID